MANDGTEGHRQRLRERFLAGEADARSDQNLLELLLTFAVGRKDVQPLAAALLRTFGSLSQALSASHAELLSVTGIGEASVALLKAVDFLRSQPTAAAAGSPAPGTEATQGTMFETPTSQPDDPQEPSTSEAAPVSEPGKKKNRTARKLQVSNSYPLDFDQLARILHFLLEQRQAKKISRQALQDDTGLAERQIGSLVSMGAAMGLIVPGAQVLTPVGLLLAEHDIFLENRGSLEWCHYAGAGSFGNLVWFDVFNHLLAEIPPMTQDEWTARLRHDLAGKYTQRTISKSLQQEVRFVVDAYTERNFRKLGLLHLTPDEQLYLRRYTQFAPPVLAAMIYDFCAAQGTNLCQVGDMLRMPGSPALIFGLDQVSFRQQIEGLHDRGWLRYETTHNLDQIRLKPEYSPLGLLRAYYQ